VKVNDMNSGEYIQRKLQAWAERKGIPLQGSAGARGEKNYTRSVEENIFGGRLHDSVAAAIRAGAGGELNGDIPKMSALHSSSTMAVNLFQYWLSNGNLKTLAKLLEIPSRNILSAEIESQFPVCDDPKSHGFKRSPHLDFAFRYQDGAHIGVECKLFEPYRNHSHSALRRAYLDLNSAWDDIPACRALAKQLATGCAGYQRLGASQLLKHILGLKFRIPTHNVRLIYLYLDSVGDEAAEHRQEIRRFQDAIMTDPFMFVPMSIQEFIFRAIRLARTEHMAYVDYLAGRYL
jgi:hypothetical protein